MSYIPGDEVVDISVQGFHDPMVETESMFGDYTVEQEPSFGLAYTSMKDGETTTGYVGSNVKETATINEVRKYLGFSQNGEVDQKLVDAVNKELGTTYSMDGLVTDINLESVLVQLRNKGRSVKSYFTIRNIAIAGVVGVLGYFAVKKLRG